MLQLKHISQYLVLPHPLLFSILCSSKTKLVQFLKALQMFLMPTMKAEDCVPSSTTISVKNSRNGAKAVKCYANIHLLFLEHWLSECFLYDTLSWNSTTLLKLPTT